MGVSGTQARRRRIGTGVLGILVALVLPAAAQAATPLPPGAEVARSAETGKLRFLGTEPGRPAARAPGLSAASAPSAAGRAFLKENSAAFGLKGASTLRTVDRQEGPKGAVAVRYQQYVEGIEVLGGEFAVQLDDRNRVLSVSGEALPAEPLDTRPAIAAAAAEAAARASVARAEGVPAGELEAGDAALRIFDSRLLGGPGLDRPTPAWAVTVRAPSRAIARLVVIDAALGTELATMDQRHAARERQVCDGQNSTAELPCTAPELTEGGTYAGPGEADINRAYEYSGATYDFFESRFGRDSLDGKGLPLKSTVRHCPDASLQNCPYANAFWDSTRKQMVYGEGYAGADDVVGHELAHGLTQFTSGLFYYEQAGAINESLSDVFGELIDRVTPSPGDAAADKWKIGESLPRGVIRDMSNPQAFGHPDSMASPAFELDPSMLDAGGVHRNSGVNNKAAFLMADGGSFRGQVVSGLGIEKTARIYYLVQTAFLTAASDYADLGSALPQACDSLLGSAGITEADCAEVRKVVLATGMDTDHPSAVDRPGCAAGQFPAYASFDDLEGPSGWVRGTDGLGGNDWYSPQNSNPYGFDATYATSGTHNLWGYARGSRGDFAIEMREPVAIPGDGLLRFRHAYAFESAGGNHYDGGVVEYRAGAGPWTALDSPSYGGVISSDSDNPLKGRRAFVGRSKGYVSTSIALPAALAGQSVRFRFRIGTDADEGDLGWFIDDVGVHTCGADTTPPETTVTSGPEEGSATTDASPTFAFRSSEPGSRLRCRVDGAGFTPCLSPRPVGPLEDGVHTFEVAAVDPAGLQDPTPARRTFTVDRAAPDTTITGGPAEGATVAEAGGMTFASDEEAASFECRLGEGAFAGCASPLELGPLAPGEQAFEVRAIDAAGNVDPTPARRAFAVAVPAPSDLDSSGGAAPVAAEDPASGGAAAGVTPARVTRAGAQGRARARR